MTPSTTFDNISSAINAGSMEGIKRSLKKSPFLWSAAFALLLLGQVLGYMTNFATWLSGLGASLISGMAVAWVWLGILLKAQGPHPLSSDLEVKVRSLQRVATVLFWFGVFGFLTVPNLDGMKERGLRS